jgi:hypothetical protein
MAITSLNNFSIQVSGSNEGMLMPKLKYRFRVTFLGFGTQSSTELTKQVMDITRPTVNFEEIEVPVYNSRIYLAGRNNWEPVTLNVRDDASGNVSKLTAQQIQKQFDFMEQASARSGIDYKFQTNIEILDGGNGANEPFVLERWELYGCFLQNANYNDLNYATNESSNITLAIRFDNALQKPDGSGVGVSVGRQASTESATGLTPGGQ